LTSTDFRSSIQVDDSRSIIRVGGARAWEVVAGGWPAAPIVGGGGGGGPPRAGVAGGRGGGGGGGAGTGGGGGGGNRRRGRGTRRLWAERGGPRGQRGGRALRGRATPQEASIPYAALADALRVARRAEPAVWEAARARAGILWAVAPELASEASGPGRSAD